MTTGTPAQLSQARHEGMTSPSALEFGLEWDRDQLLHLASLIRRVFWPLSVFFILPTVLFVLIRRTHMDRDCKAAFVAHNVILGCFDVYNCLFYQLYTLLPYPVFACTGILCNERHSPRTLFTVLSFWTTVMCVPYMFVMMRMHQKMLNADSPLKLSYRSQALLMLGFTVVLASNVYGFGAWSVESAEKDNILQMPSLAWAKNQSSNFLVLGKKSGDIGVFDREMYLLMFSIVVCFSFYVATTYHAVFVIGKQTFRSKHRSRTYQIQLRFMLSMSIQAFFTSVLFILPLVFLFVFLITPLGNFVPTWMGPLRMTLMVMYSCCSIGHSTVFLCKSTWVIQTVRRLIDGKTLVEATKTNHVSFSSSIVVIHRLT